MIEFIISVLFIVSPQDSTSTPFDITLIFDPPVDTLNIEVYIDNNKITGEIESDYFYSEIMSLSKGMHKIKVNYDEEMSEMSFTVYEKTEKIPIDIWGNISLGLMNSYYSDTLLENNNGPIGGLDFFITRGKNSINLLLLHDPDYPSTWYPYINYSHGTSSIEAGYIYPYFNEITVYSPSGWGAESEINLGLLCLQPFFLYSESYDTLFTEYPRYLFGSRIGLELNRVSAGITCFFGTDDTMEVTGFPITDPQKSIVISPEIEFQTTKNTDISIRGGFSKGCDNMFLDSLTKGFALNGEFVYEHNFNYVTIGAEYISEDYLTLGNPYIYRDRFSVYINGIYEKNELYTDFEHMLYRKDAATGFSMLQSFRIEINNHFSPVLELQWSKYPEYDGEEYQYIAAGFESNIANFMISSLFGFNRYISFDESEIFNLSSNLSWYNNSLGLSIGSFVSLSSDYNTIDLNLDLNLKLWDFGYINMYYYPFFENGYEKHILRIIYEYGF